MPDTSSHEYNEQHYRSLFTYNPDAVFSLNPAGEFVQINQSGCDLIDAEEHDILGKHYEMLVVEEDRERTRRHFEAALAGNHQRYEIRIRNMQGEILQLDILNIPIIVNGQVTGVHGQARDRTRERQTEARLRILERSVEASSSGVTIADAGMPGFPLIYVNPAFERMTGYRADEIVGANCRILQGPDTSKAAIASIRSGLADMREVHTSLLNYRKDGSSFWNDLYIAPVRDSDEEVTHFIGIQTDISDRIRQEEVLTFQASHDSLTGLPNRIYLESHLQGICRRARARQLAIHALFIDLDGFKPINDSLGHAFGDDILSQTARRIEAALPSDSTLVRFGGDEFVALVSAPEDRQTINRIAELILEQFSKPFLNEDVEITLSAAIGIATGNGALDNSMLLIQQSDMAMYEAKKLGGNTWQWFNKTLDRRVQHEVALRQQLQQALATNQFELFYQPLFNNELAIVGVEALIRWNHPDRGYISPAEYIPLSERTGQILPISEWVMQEAFARAAELAEIGVPSVSINLSPLQFHRHNLVERLASLNDQYQLAPGQLCVEITENVFLTDPKDVIRQLREIRSMGIEVAIDDFGTGFSSLSYMRDMPVNRIKIDRSFVNGITSNASDAAITRGTLSMARELGMSVVAEGVETEEQFRLLQQFGCSGYQGFWYSRALPLADLRAFSGAPGRTVPEE
ncbi:EAL domain-containing protein [Marinobacter sp. SS13-12]|uniref:putative bifunctional diguanylate cyclase/phosphodiesterase n=1 Tax=Marinobacter sp. SS13-12 TaxID=3050451 RepID=UPI0025538FF1|nr:EAL domain-containing protein [Marinobacter sp. SS13-12]MDK8462395.1 EAL domain-containing protein [Marinobacter sp. SS13-12]